jgi:hypothetical protein
MSTYAENYPGERRTHERRNGFYPAMVRGFEGLRVSWGGVWAGVLSAVALLMLLAALGLAVGVTTAEPGQTDAQALGAGAGIWAAASLLIALFVGGIVSTRTGGVSDRTTGFFEGLLVWVVSLLLLAYLAMSGIGAITGGAMKLLTTAGTVAGVAGAQSGRVDVSSGDVSQIAGRLRDPQTAQKIASATGLPRSEVQQTLGETAQKVEASKDDPKQAAEAARQGVAQLYDKAKSSGALQQKVAEAQPAAQRGAWATFGALVISLLAAVIGAMIGRRRIMPAPRTARVS